MYLIEQYNLVDAEAVAAILAKSVVRRMLLPVCIGNYYGISPRTRSVAFQIQVGINDIRNCLCRNE